MSDKPHVLLISTDHWPNSLLGVSGHPAIQTPTLDALAHAGTRFTRGYSECPVCVPARKTLMTGTTTRTHKDRVFNDQQGINGLPTIAQTFQRLRGIRLTLSVSFMSIPNATESGLTMCY